MHCAKNAVCENTPGSFQCVCKIGYSSNGKHCEGKTIHLSGFHFSLTRSFGSPVCLLKNSFSSLCYVFSNDECFTVYILLTRSRMSLSLPFKFYIFIFTQISMNARTVSNAHTMLNVKIPKALTNVVAMMVIMVTEKLVKVHFCHKLDCKLVQFSNIQKHNLDNSTSSKLCLTETKLQCISSLLLFQ